jgi:hypothetical protein
LSRKLATVEALARPYRGLEVLWLKEGEVEGWAKAGGMGEV